MISSLPCSYHFS